MDNVPIFDPTIRLAKTDVAFENHPHYCYNIPNVVSLFYNLTLN